VHTLVVTLIPTEYPKNMKTETQVKLPLDPQQEAQVKRAIRDIPDFPKPGIMFKDLTPL
jgi:hypothetical protein